MNDDHAASPGLDERVCQVRRLSAEGRVFEAKRFLVDALTGKGKSANLLQELAWIENQQGNHDDAAAHLAEASILDPSSITIARDRLETMRISGLYNEARYIARGLSEELRDEPSIRAVLGTVYRALGWHAHAVEAYGSQSELQVYDRFARSASWLRAGGPLRTLRTRTCKTENSIDDVWKAKSTEQRATLAELDLPHEPYISEVGARLDTCLLQLLTAQHRREVAEQRADNPFWKLALIGLGWAFSLMLIYLVWEPIYNLSDAMFLALFVAELAGAIIFCINVAVKRYTTHLRRRPALIWRRSLAIALIGLIFSYLSRNSSWPSAVALTISVAGIMYGLWKGSLYGSDDMRIYLVNENPREYILANLLDVLKEVGGCKRNDLRSRKQWMTHLRNAAWVMEHCLPGYLDDPDPAVRGWIAEQTTGAAGKIRMLAGYIGLPREGAWDQLVSDLQHSAKMIVMGDFGSVQSERPSLSSQSRIRRHLFADIAFVALALVLLIGLVGVLIILRDRTMVDVAETTAVTTSVALLAGVLIKPLQGRVGGRQSSQDETLNQ